MLTVTHLAKKGLYLLPSSGNIENNIMLEILNFYQSKSE